MLLIELKTRRCVWAVISATLLLAACSDAAQEEAESLPPCEVLRQLQARSGAAITNPTPGVDTLSTYIIQDGRVSAGIPAPCSQAVARRLEESACPICNDSPGQCESLVRAIFDRLPGECATCGDGTCLAGVESALTCAVDCASNCGDAICDADESEESCALDCSQPCGDGICAGNESPESCAADCDFTVGDGLCSTGENPIKSPNDCAGQLIGQRCEGDEDCRGARCDTDARRCVCNVEGAGVCANTTCGDGYCQTYETTFGCAEDCCGDAVCQLGAPAACLDAQTRVQCVEGEGSCPAAEVIETCELGCVDGECSLCPLDMSFVPCQGNGMRCQGLAVFVCTPLPGFPGCNVERVIRCSETDGGSCTPDRGCTNCTGNCTLDALETTRCGEDGVTLERCALTEGATCPSWVPAQRCEGDLRCDLLSHYGACR